MNDKGTIWEGHGERDGLSRKDEPVASSDTLDKQCQTPSGQEWKAILCLLILAIPFAIMGWMFVGGWGFFVNVEANEYVVCRTPAGHFRVYDTPGMKLKFFSSVWRYPRYYNVTFGRTSATFNDNKKRSFETITSIALPTTTEYQLKFHKEIIGDMETMDQLIKGEVENIIVATAPIMSGQEVLTSRKAEFAQLITDQITNGLYLYHVTKNVDANSVTAEIVRDELGEPTIFLESVLPIYGIGIRGFYIKDTQIPAEEARCIERKNFAEQLIIRTELETKLMRVQAQYDVDKAQAEADVEVEKAKIEAEKAIMLNEIKMLDQIEDKTIIVIEADRMLENK